MKPAIQYPLAASFPDARLVPAHRITTSFDNRSTSAAQSYSCTRVLAPAAALLAARPVLRRPFHALDDRPLDALDAGLFDALDAFRCAAAFG
jgi:hypothetical protein